MEKSDVERCFRLSEENQLEFIRFLRFVVLFQGTKAFAKPMLDSPGKVYHITQR